MLATGRIILDFSGSSEPESWCEVFELHCAGGVILVCAYSNVSCWKYLSFIHTSMVGETLAAAEDDIRTEKRAEPNATMRVVWSQSFTPCFGS